MPLGLTKTLLPQRTPRVTSYRKMQPRTDGLNSQSHVDEKESAWTSSVCKLSRHGGMDGDGWRPSSGTAVHMTILGVFVNGVAQHHGVWCRPCAVRLTGVIQALLGGCSLSEVPFPETTSKYRMLSCPEVQPSC